MRYKEQGQIRKYLILLKNVNLSCIKIINISRIVNFKKINNNNFIENAKKIKRMSRNIFYIQTYVFR